ncbi:hypothetical protein POSPLADRAFT_1060461 [Postia placenta MAD-698-R-SB12]|uniref:Retrotransposon gag domain-containing protein n=1 Tax=Postia placenta MAD-698-R-SB12 TaxID=670580 RepID=A0A1X6MQ86_9APHY|nr:hypothetical protein POSPLADRAFT_1060461 [Postia placenta MAD-698-R-SB12]OSX58574.1 hypothetical protein POSPLADRAFT_1060461 [Postia placenta MAD-698-R-SB12]
MNSSVSALQWAILVLTDAWLRFLLHTSQKQYWAPPRAPPLPPPLTVADEFFDCSRLEHTFDTQEQPLSSSVIGNHALIEPHGPSPPTKGATYQSDESSIPAAQHFGTLAHRDLPLITSLLSHLDLPLQAPASPNLSPVQPSVTPQAIPQSSLGPRLERPPKTEPRDTPPHSWAGSSSAVTASTSVPILRHPASGLPQSTSPPSPLRGRSSTRSSRSSPGGQSQQSPSPAGSPSSPSSPIMSSPAAVPDKETLKLLLPLQYDGKLVVECNCFISQLLIYWTINMALSSLELKIQLASVQIGIQGATTPFADEKAFLKAFKARFGNLDDAAAAQVELSKLCANKTMRKKRTAAEFSALFKGPADRSGYGNLELRNKYLSGIPSRIYRKLELETFATWQDTDKCATEVEQILDHKVEDAEGHVVVHPRHMELRPASMRPSEKETSLAPALAVGSKGTDDSSAPIAATSAPVTTTPSASISATSAKSEQSELADLMAQVKSMCEELEHYRAMKEEGF